MKNKKCPLKKRCFDYKDDNCTGCEIGEKIAKLHKQIDRLKKQNKNLTIERNAWFLTAKAMKNEWISVEDRLPSDDEWVLISSLFNGRVRGIPLVAHISCGEWWVIGDSYPLNSQCPSSIVTHWQPLPEPPIESEDTE